MPFRFPCYQISKPVHGVDQLPHDVLLVVWFVIEQHIATYNKIEIAKYTLLWTGIPGVQQIVGRKSHVLLQTVAYRIRIACLDEKIPQVLHPDPLDFIFPIFALGSQKQC